jgi:phage terminase large subunit-like protein
LSKGEVPAWAIRTEADRRAIAEGCFWDGDKADAIITFVEKAFRSQFIVGPVKLRDIQRQLLQQIEGWRLPDGRRRWRVVNLHCPKKGFGKTLLVAIYSYYSLFSGLEPSPTVYTAAATRDNASQIFKEVKYACEQSGLVNFCKVRNNTKEIEVPSLNASFKSLCSLGDKNHGWNCSTVVIDEAHVVPAELWNALRYATDARPQNGLVFVISTAGTDTTSWYYSLYTKSKRVIQGEDLDITHLPLVFEADKDADPEDVNQWYKANPYLGTPEFPLDQFRRDFESAKSSGMAEFYNFLRLKLNLWVKPSELAFFDVTDWESHEKAIPDEVLRKARMHIGADLSQTTDPSTVANCWELPDGSYHLRGWAWVCEDGIRLREKSNLPKYDDFPELEYTPGEQIDYRTIRDHITDQCKEWKTEGVNFDTTGAFIMAGEIEDEGYTAQRVPQNFKHFDPAMVELRRLWQEGKVSVDPGSKWLRYCFQNVRIEMNKYGEVRPHRGRSVDKIDGAVACLLAFLGLIAEPPATNLGGVG